MSVSFPLHGFEPDQSAWNTVSVQHPGTPTEAESRSGKVDLGHGHSAFVGARHIPARGQWWGKVEFNPARMSDPEGYSLAELGEVVDLVERAWSSAGELVEPACRAEDARIKRLDVAKDFATEHGSYLVRSLGPVHRPWARRNLVHFDPSRGGAETLMVGSGAGLVRLYDKEAESAGKAPTGTLRWECEARSSWAKQYGGLEVVGDLRETERVEHLAAERWEWSQMGAEVSGTEATIERVQRLGLSPAKERGLVGWMVMRAYGVESSMATHTASEYRRLARAHGLAMSRDELDGLVRIRLDWESGEEVRSDAA